MNNPIDPSTVILYGTFHQPSTFHPRVCGEHPDGYVMGRHGIGSSPRMWGTLHFKDQLREFPRFIPAYVGNTCRVSSTPVLYPVHPRVCGEHLTPKNATYPPDGSSPRMWGTPVQLPHYSHHNRFIPAYVGNTASSRTGCRKWTVHPRVCGEHT